MGKNIELLTKVSKKFTEDTLKTVFFNATGEKSVFGWNFEPAAAKGDNYLSVIYRITLDGIVKGVDTSLKIIVKGLPYSLSSRKTFRSTDFFENEINFYNKIIPLYEKFLESKGQKKLLPVPRCYAFCCDGENDFIVLEDVRTLGYSHIARQNAWDLKDCQIILKALAQFHAVSAACKDQCPTEYLTATKHVKEVLFADKFWDWYNKFYTNTVNIAKDAVQREYKDTPEAAKFIAMSSRQLFEKEIECCSHRDSPTSIVNHGDSWAPNFMTRKINSPEENEAVILDFQAVRCASPVLDISFFLYNSTDKECRNHHFENLLKFYHQVFSETVNMLGSDVNKIYPWNVFMKEVKDQFCFGFSFSLEQLPAAMLDESEALDIDGMPATHNDEPVNIAEVWKLKPTIESQKNRQRIADVVVHAIQQGYI